MGDYRISLSLLFLNFFFPMFALVVVVGWVFVFLSPWKARAVLDPVRT